ncbi:MAG: response regulator transcription factor, partial [Deltaproteobacteria bacterium]|nr:response regulator transcription factor [Deltaproteobacteria bacterium]
MAKIMILVPDESLAGSLSEAVQRAGWLSVVYSTGKEALSCFLADQPALVVLDLQIDDSHGVELCRTIRETHGGELIPILLVGTGAEGVQNFGDALVEGGDYYFEKPLELPRVISKIRTYVGIDRDAPTQVGPPPVVDTSDQADKDQEKDLTQRVEQMMDLGAAFKDGLLAPPTGNDGERIDQLEKQL